MQIHELNNFTGTLGAGAYLAIDDGNDTGKISSQGLLAATEARIDNIIAGPASSAEEVIDARLGADGVTYASLGDAIRDQFINLKTDLSEETDNLIWLHPYASYGLTITEVGPELYAVNGTATSGVYLRLNGSQSSLQISPGTYTFGVFFEDSSNVIPDQSVKLGFYYNTINSSSTAQGAQFITRGTPVTMTFDTNVYIFFRIVNNGMTYNNMRFRFMVRRGASTRYIPHLSAYDYIARYISEDNALVSRGDKPYGFYAWDLLTKTLTIKENSFAVTKGGQHLTVRAQTVDFSGVTTTYNAYRILVDRNGYVSGKAWNDKTTTDKYCIGLIYGNYLQIFGVNDNVMSSKQRVFCFGDSITAGVNSTKQYHQILAEKEGVICYNWGVGSTGYATTASGSLAVGDGVIGDGSAKEQSGNNSVLDIMTGKSFDACIIFAGTNDYGTNKAIATFRTAVQNVLDAALQQTNNILVITPLKRNYNGVPYTQANSAGHVLADYSAVIKEECESRKIAYVDGFDINLDPTNANIMTRLMPDGLHPNDEGQKRIAGAVRQAFEENCGVL